VRMGWFRLKRGMARVRDLRVQLDPLNPGQFYACCGLLELAALAHGPVVSRFEPEPGRPRVSWFCLHDVPSDFLGEALEQLRGAASSVSFDDDFEAGISPTTLIFGNHALELDWWLDKFRERPVPLKCWAGQVTTRKLFEELLGLLDGETSGSAVFQRSRLTKSKFGVDPRAAWNARDCGYSPNEHGTDSSTFVAVEVFAAIGLQTFWPVVQRRNRTALYHLWTAGLPVCVARSASKAPWDGLPHHAFQFSIASRGQSYKYFRFGQAAKQTRERT
jgi:CRISPR-associated protein Csx14